jgi:hypothetical protein
MKQSAAHRKINRAAKPAFPGSILGQHLHCNGSACIHYFEVYNSKGESFLKL